MSSERHPASLNPAQRFSVRVMLATGATVVTLMGAQVLALAERTAAPAGSNVDVVEPSPTPTLSRSVNAKVVATSTPKVAQQIRPAPAQPQPFTRSTRRR